jgi:hypothetical protein
MIQNHQTTVQRADNILLKYLRLCDLNLFSLVSVGVYHGYRSSNIMKAYGGMEVWVHSFLISAMDGGDLSASCPAALPLTPTKD